MAKKIRESEVKNRIKKDYFSDFDWTKVVGDIDLTVCSDSQSGMFPTTYLWAETKNGTNKDIYESFIQLILTIGKARTYEHEMPPYFLGAADAEKIAFVEYNKVMHIFSKNDFNWNVTPSDHGTKEFEELYGLLHDELAKDVVLFKFAYEDKQIRSFIKKNFKEGRTDVKKISVGKNNFTFVYYDWVKSVKDSIAVDWKALQKIGVLDCDFFLADLMSKDGMSIKDKLKVVLEKTKYKVLVKADIGGMFEDAFKEFPFKDDQKAYNQFWNRYERPPKPIYQRYILERRDLLVPQDIREIKGSYYTPEQWVRLSQEYLARVLGEDWQEEYFIWDCAAGSGNLLRGLTNKYNIYASTLDDSDVKVMHDVIDGGRLSLVKENVFQFDFLNDAYEKDSHGNIISTLTTCNKIPETLRNILADEEKRRKLIIYINPPYLQSGNAKTSAGTGSNKTGATKGNCVRELCQKSIGPAADEMFALFTWRICTEIPSCVLAEFSTLKILQAPNFSEFRKNVNLCLRSVFIVPGDTFDNVSGDFPIGFHIYNTNERFVNEDVTADVYNLKFKDVYSMGTKVISGYYGHKLINTWVAKYLSPKNRCIQPLGFVNYDANDFQHSNYINIYSEQRKSHSNRPFVSDSCLPIACYHAVRKIPVATWLNDRDQFLAPKESWAGDLEFQLDCLVWSIFNNSVKEENGICHWIPFYEQEVDSPAPFNSRFMADFLHGKITRKPIEVPGSIWEQQDAEEASKKIPLEVLSDEAKSALSAGKEIWKYYMTKPGISANASFLDIRAYFQGHTTTAKGKKKMNIASSDEHYMVLLQNLRERIKELEAHIEPKIYEHGFLLQ